LIGSIGSIASIGQGIVFVERVRVRGKRIVRVVSFGKLRTGPSTGLRTGSSFDRYACSIGCASSS
jgi:hypothetical protein